MADKSAQMELEGMPVGHRSHTCLRCGRPLRNAKSIEWGYGAVCAAKMRIQGAEKEGNVSAINDSYIDRPITDGLILSRSADGKLATNVPHYAVEHSPMGYEWGYGGSGPADLALNTVEAILISIGQRGDQTEPLWDGHTVSEAAWRLHQDFKFRFIGSAPREVGVFTLEYDVMREWIKRRLADG